MPPKASPKKQKKASKAPKKEKKTKKTVPTVVTISNIDEQIEQSQSLLDTGAVARLAGSDVKDGDGGEASSQTHSETCTISYSDISCCSLR